MNSVANAIVYPPNRVTLKLPVAGQKIVGFGDLKLGYLPVYLLILIISTHTNRFGVEKGDLASIVINK